MRSHALRKMPIASLSPGDLRFLLVQSIGTKHLVPLTSTVLEAEPLLDSGYYPGDLLHVLLQRADEHWSADRHSFERLIAVARRASLEMSALAESTGADVSLSKVIDAFLGHETH